MTRLASKKSVIAAALAVVFAAGLLAPASAHRYNRVDDTHPLRLVSYVVHPIGIAVEHVILRPIHWVVSRDDLDIWFGHKASVNDDGTYYEWVHGDYSPSIYEEREAIRQAQAETETTE